MHGVCGCHEGFDGGDIARIQHLVHEATDGFRVVKWGHSSSIPQDEGERRSRPGPLLWLRKGSGVTYRNDAVAAGVDGVGLCVCVALPYAAYNSLILDARRKA